jgi:hypothetical protein
MAKPKQTAQNSSVSVGVTSVVVMPARNSPGLERLQLIITNTSATQTITIALGDLPAVAGAGIRLPPNGVYAESTDNKFDCWQDNINAISDAALGTLAVVERMREVQE